jgi:hypothetical protein
MWSLSIWHGEARTLYTVVWENPDDPADWEVVATYGDPAAAQDELRFRRLYGRG